MNGESAKNIVLAASLAALATGTGAWLISDRDQVTRAEMREYVQPLQFSVEKLIDTQKALLIEQRALVERFNAYLTISEKRSK